MTQFLLCILCEQNNFFDFYSARATNQNMFDVLERFIRKKKAHIEKKEESKVDIFEEGEELEVVDLEAEEEEEEEEEEEKDEKKKEEKKEEEEEESEEEEEKKKEDKSDIHMNNLIQNRMDYFQTRFV